MGALCSSWNFASNLSGTIVLHFNARPFLVVESSFFGTTKDKFTIADTKFVYGMFAAFTVLGQQFFRTLLKWNEWLAIIPTITVVILFLRPLENYLIQITDKFLFQKKYNYKEVIRSFVKEIATVMNLDEIVSRTIILLEKTLHPENIAFFLLNRTDDKYHLYHSSGYDARNLKLEKDSELLLRLKSNPTVFFTGNHANGRKISERFRQEMEAFKARLAIPLSLHTDLVGIMVLGPKKSGEDYSDEELDILTDLSRTESMAIGNAMLLAQAAQNERRAAIGTMAAGINHEIGNPLHVIGTKIQLFLMSLEKGLYKDTKPENIIEESKAIMTTCLRQISRIANIAQKLSNFAKPSKLFKPESTDIEEQINETLSVVGHELELERIEIRKEIESNLSKISADKSQIQQILFKLITQ